MKNKKPKANSKKQKEKMNQVQQSLDAVRRVRERLDQVLANLEAVGSGQIQQGLKATVRHFIDNQDDEENKRSIEAVRSLP